MIKSNVDIDSELKTLIAAIASARTYSGRPVSSSIMAQIEIETRLNGAGILAPFWLSVLERGRGPRKSTKSSDLWRRIYAWMDKNNLFTAKTERGRENEAKRVTWYMNKHGNQHFRDKQFIDVYTAARKKCIADVEKKYTEFAFKITSDIL